MFYLYNNIYSEFWMKCIFTLAHIFVTMCKKSRMDICPVIISIYLINILQFTQNIYVFNSLCVMIKWNHYLKHPLNFKIRTFLITETVVKTDLLQVVLCFRPVNIDLRSATGIEERRAPGRADWSIVYSIRVHCQSIECEASSNKFRRVWRLYREPGLARYWSINVTIR